MSTLIRVAKGGESIAVHPTCLEAHLRTGWSVSEDQTDTEAAPASPAGDKPLADMSRKELDALAAERGVDIKDAKNKGDVIAALELAMEEANAATPDGTITPVPEDWESLPEAEQIALAEVLTGGEVVPTGEQTEAEKAHSIIMATVTDRANPPQG